MKPEDMAIIIVDELIEDIDNLGNSFLSLLERSDKYSKQFKNLLPPEKFTELNMAIDIFNKRLMQAAKES